ncbi:cytochrome c biogenesis protein CcsA [bacterium]|nr:cytochrome c biogenesis protein CcsA [bacterium]
MRISADNFSIYLAFACALISFACWFAAAISQSKLWHLWAKRLYAISVIGIAYAALYLLQQILSSARYDVAYIHDYSSPTDSLLYKISSLWAGQEGSLLLWALLAGIMGLVISRKQSSTVMAFWASVQSFFLVLLIKSDPFRMLADYSPGAQGMGLNPLLKNPWMSVHPPVIFLGYAALIVPAALAVAALVKGDPKSWVRQCIPWALFGWVSLSAGIILGMIWSYEVLGWGGYWSWDPVENASLVPWLTSTALVHGLILQKYKGRNIRGNVILAIVTFLLVLYAAFLTRSGVLSKISVHSFADLGAYSYLLAFVLAYALFSIVLVISRWNSISTHKPHITLASKDFMLSLGIIVMVVFAVVVAVGTSYPLFTKSILQPSFYTRMSVPIAGVIILLIVLAPILPWSGKGIKSRSSRAAYMAHAGMIVMIAGIVFSLSGRSADMTLVKNGSAKRALGYEFAYVGTKKIDDTKEVINIKMSGKGKESIAPLGVEYSQRGSVRSPFIRSSLTGDMYISPGDILANTITPVASMTERGWEALPFTIPGTKSTVTLVGMQVESHMVRLEYRPEHGKPVEITLSPGKPAKVDGYTFDFQRFVSSGGRDMRTMTAGAQLAMSGNGMTEKVVIQAAEKPFIWLLWAGAVLILVGGSLAVVRSMNQYTKY